MRLMLALTVVLSISTLLSAQDAGRGGRKAGGAAAAVPAMTLTIPGFPDGGQIPVKFSQAAPGAAPGEGTSPAMTWADVPAGTQSFFLHMHDLDLARNKTTDDQAHWVLWNIPATTTQLPDGSYQVSATGPMYRGPGAAANGPLHHYVFELYALDTKLEVKPTADAF